MDDSRPHAPISLCSPKFRTFEADGFAVTEVWFPPHTRIPRHIHRRPVLGVMLEGGFDDVFSGRTLSPRAGDIFSEPGEEPHANHIGSAGARVLVLQPDVSNDELWRAGRNVLDEIKSMRHDGVADSARQIAHEIRHPDELTTLAIESLALDMVVTAARHAVHDDERAGEPGWLKRVDELVLDGFAQPLRVKDIAAEVGVHRSHVARSHRRFRGLSLGERIRRLRLDWAAERVASSNDGLSSIAIKAGYADQSHLTRAFKARFGVPPGAYRASRRNAPAESDHVD